MKDYIYSPFYSIKNNKLLYLDSYEIFELPKEEKVESFDVDELVRKIDAKIAELEKEELANKKKQETQITSVEQPINEKMESKIKSNDLTLDDKDEVDDFFDDFFDE